MQEDNKPSNVKDTVDAVTGLVKAIPVYQDTIQPAAKQVGQSLETVAKTVNIALAPIKAFVWGYEKIEDFIASRVSEKLKNVPQEDIVTPKPEVAVPAVEALRYSGHNEELRELYANLLANAMDKKTIDSTHPAFVEILKNITSDEAILLQAFLNKNQYALIDVKAQSKPPDKGYAILVSNFSHLSKVVAIHNNSLIPSYIDNLCRLGILEIPEGRYLVDEVLYQQLENDANLQHLRKQVEVNMGRTFRAQRKIIQPTFFGNIFIENVVKPKEKIS